MMKHAAKISGKFGVLGKLAAALAVGFAMNAAQAANNIVTFEGIDSGFVGDSDYYEMNGIDFAAYSNVSGATPGDLVGSVVDGNDLAGGPCYGLACPTNNKTTFFTVVNDGVVEITPVDPAGSVHVYGLDASFVGAVQGGSYPLTAGILNIQGLTATGTVSNASFNLAGPVGGNFSFQHFSTDAAFAAQNFIAVDIFGYVCNTAGNCKAFQTNQGQFALDNIDLGPAAVSAVPEPSSWLMLGLGLAGIAVAARRKNKRA